MLYNLGLILASPLIVLILQAKMRCRRGLTQRLGWLPADLAGGSGPTIWLHAVSLGEVVASAPLVQALHRRYPGCRFLVSTVTETGREAVEQRLPGVARHFYAPLDFSWVVPRVVALVRPAAFLVVETELWPNLLRMLARRGVPIVLVNGRLSSRSFGRYRLIRPLMRHVLGAVTCCLMQSRRDAERVMALGADPGRVHVTGNLKFDQPLPAEECVSRAALGLAGHEELFVAGSTHPGEEEQILACYERLVAGFPSLVLLLAPRHIERVAQVEAAVKARGLVGLRRTALRGAGDQGPAGPRVVILDTRGELAGAYRHALLAFVGGTLVPVGGHNLLEPAQWGKPVFFGPHTDHCAEVARLLLDAGGGLCVRDGADLAARVTGLLHDRGTLQQMGLAAQRVVTENRGALDRSLDLIAKVLDGAGSLDGAVERAASPSVSPGDGRASGAAPSRIRDMRAETRDRHGMGGLALRQTLIPLERSGLVRGLLSALAIPYGLAVRTRVALYERGWLARRRLPGRVVSVGNLTLGGTGKTPVVIWLVGQLLARGFRVAVLSRGYRRTTGASRLLVSDGRRILAGPAEAGDEPSVIARRCPGAVVAVGADRYGLGRWVLEYVPVDCFVLDDGFQHLALHRDADLLLVDASAPDDLAALFPAGRLREPLSAAARATALLLTRVGPGVDPEQVLGPLRAAGPLAMPPILVRFGGEGCITVATGREEPADVLAGRKVLACCGIGNPASFRATLADLNVTVVDEAVFPDHHAYTARELSALLERAGRLGAELVVTTEKDAVKLAPLVGAEERVRAVRIGLEILEGRERLEQLILP
ncbi:tetraacyldisaccharide 4'-kinase [Nitrospira sp. Kam-Ns4a]